LKTAARDFGGRCWRGVALLQKGRRQYHGWFELPLRTQCCEQRLPFTGDHQPHTVVAHFGGALEVFMAGPTAALAALDGEPLNGLFSAVPDWADTAQRTRHWLAASPHHHVIPLGHANYPAALLNSPDPPLVLHAIGALEGLQRSAVAIVGSRHATPAGIQVAQRLSAELSVLGIEVVSGLAVGIDAAAHESALGTGGDASTIAVVASGLDDVYPRQHRPLFHRIANNGLVVSEHPLGTPALPAYFPQRNRIIAGLSRAVVVVEATVRSGSLITARLAAEAGRDVLAVPGHPGSAQSAGCNQLIKNGAGLLEHVADIVESQPWAFDAATRRAVQPHRRRRPRGAEVGAVAEANSTAAPTQAGELSTASWSRARRSSLMNVSNSARIASSLTRSSSRRFISRAR